MNNLQLEFTVKKPKKVGKKVKEKERPKPLVKVQPVLKRKQKVKDTDEIKKIKIKVIGIGNGAGSIVADIAPKIKRVKFLAANTDKLALLKLKRKVEIFQFGQAITGGFGTGMDPSLGQIAAEKETERIERVLKDCDLCIFVACLGGGTGSGATPIFAKVAKKLGSLTYGIFTLPFNFEGEKKLEIAKEALKNLKPFVNAFSLCPNESIFKIVDKKLPLKKALFAINKILAFALEGLFQTIYKPGIINIDFADLKAILKGQGQLAYLNRTEAQGEQRAEKVLEKILSNPLYPYNISKAKKALFNIAGPQNLSIAELSQISQGIANSLSKEAKIIFGVSREKEKEKVEITLLAVGCEMKDFFLVPERAKKAKKPTELQKTEKVKKTTKKSQILKKESKKPKIKESSPFQIMKEKVRKNALEVQKANEELEKEIRKREEIWETPAFLRKKI